VYVYVWHFTDEPVSWGLICFIHRLCASALFWERIKLFKSSSTPPQHIFLRHPLGLIPSISITVQCLIQSVLSLHPTRPSHLRLSFLINKLPNSSINSLSSPSFFLSFYFAHTFLLALFFFRSSSSYFFLHRTVSYVLLPTNFSLLSPIFRHITPVSYPSFTPYAKLHQRKVNRLYFWTQWMQEFNSVFFQRYNVLGPELTMGQWVMCQMGQHIWMVTWVMGQYLWPIEALGQCIPLPRHVLSVSRSVIRIATKI